MEMFKHTPIDMTEDQIRLVKIAHSDQADTINCTIQLYSIKLSTDLNTSLCPSYQALSYVWGPPSPMCTILLNGKLFQVRENLWWFLRHKATDDVEDGKPTSRAGHHTSYWWIDQLCIDQENPRERNHQVQRMSNIYREAQCVIAWLGEGDRISHDAITFVADIIDWKTDWDNQWWVDNRCTMYDVIKTYERVEKQWHASLSKKSLLEVSGERLLNLYWLFQRPYWSRLWVVQEFMLSRKLLILCGDDSVSSNSLLYAHQILGSCHWHDSVFRPALDMTPRGRSSTGIPLLRHISSHYEYNSFTLAVRFFSGLDCQDPRDKVYGLLGLVPAEHRIQVDYTMRSGEIFWQAIKAMQFSWVGADGPLRKAVAQLGIAMGVTGAEVGATDNTAMKNFFRLFDDDFSTAHHTPAVLRRHDESADYRTVLSWRNKWITVIPAREVDVKQLEKTRVMIKACWEVFSWFRTLKA